MAIGVTDEVWIKHIIICVVQSEPFLWCFKWYISAVVFRLFPKPVLKPTSKNGRLSVNLTPIFKPLFLINTCHFAWIKPLLCLHAVFML